jgi:lipopolysaccharide cholinephosphotransferase
MDENNPINIDWGLEPLHNKMLELLSWIHSFCVDNRIDYCLAYGSALGAVRHGGFIPWDDDVDIYMTYESYTKFKKLFLNLDQDNTVYLLQELDAIDGMVSLSKIRIKKTTFIEPLYKNSGIHQGIYIDIFILHNAPESTLRRKVMCFANQYLVLKGLSNREYKEKPLYRPLLALMRMMPKDHLRKKALEEIYKYDHYDSDTYFDVDLRKYSRSFYSKDMIFPAKETEFENIHLMIPHNTDDYLSMVYGRYKELPSIEQIKKSQHAALWDVAKDYTEYITKGLKDE